MDLSTLAFRGLPTEVCENIIDLCRSEVVLDDRSKPATRASYATLRACCLTSRSWLYRSRYHLYSIVTLQDYDDVATFLQTITQHPSLALFTHTLCISPSDDEESDCPIAYIPYARFELVQALPNVGVLLLSGVPWRLYPPKYHHLVAQFTTLTELHVCLTKQDLKDVLPIVWILRDLRYLRLVSTKQPLLLSFDEALLIRALAERRHHCCAALRKLELAATFVPMANFPPKHAFGTSVTELVLRRDNWVEPWDRSNAENDPQAMLDYIVSLDGLQTLTLAITPDDIFETIKETGERPFTIWIALVLRLLQKHAALNVLRISVGPDLNTRFWGDDYASHSRYVFLKDLATPALRELLPGLPALERFDVDLPAAHDDPYGSRDWWEEQLREQFPLLKAEISVTIVPLPTGRYDDVTVAMWIPAEEDHPNYQYKRNNSDSEGSASIPSSPSLEAHHVTHEP